MDKVLEILRDHLPFVDFENEKGLITNGVIESLDLVMIVSEISEEFDIEIGIDDLIPENFNSAEQIYQLVCKLRGDEF